jgi:3-deoxy-D-manno-octulosonate 8-phosphate phosphatase (KDO 8-P phosphatase)
VLRTFGVLFCLFISTLFAESSNIARNIKLIAFDVDGVLTHGEIIYSSSGEEIKSFNVKDGLGLVLASQNHLITAIITGRESEAVKRRAKELKVTHLFQNAKDKVKVIEKLASQYGIRSEEICFMGDDLPDLQVLKRVGLAACPSDAVNEIKAVCNWISKYEGGRGAVRELVDFVLNAQTVHQP